jgi:K+-transporting ATPase ATPase C chain
MFKLLNSAIFSTLIITFLCGILYPGLITAIGMLFFHHQATGSLMLKAGKPVGSSLIAQKFTQPHYFKPRPSAAGDGWDPLNSGASNLALVNPKLSQVPPASDIDMITASGSGLDPHIFFSSALNQAKSVAAARHVTLDALTAIIEDHVETHLLTSPSLKIVNVMKLNFMLDEKFPIR